MAQFDKQILLPQIGKSGQEKIFNAKLLIVGLGGIGSPLVRYLASAGVGTIAIIDDDIIEVDNLPRQNNFYLSDIEQLKVDVTSDLIKKLNPQVRLITYNKRLDHDLLQDIIGDYDIIIDASDNFKTKFLCNDLAHKNNKVFISGAFAGFKGYAAVYNSGIDKTKPCFRCFHPDNIDYSHSKSCLNQGVLSAGVGMVGLFMAAEAFKEITQCKSSSGKIMMFDFLQNNHHMSQLAKRKNCFCSNN